MPLIQITATGPIALAIGKISKYFLGDFGLEKIKKMFLSSKFQNGGWIQDGGENVFFILKFQKWKFFKKKLFLQCFWLEIQLCVTIFSIKLQNGG
jgi:hypothetical protein